MLYICIYLSVICCISVCEWVIDNYIPGMIMLVCRPLYTRLGLGITTLQLYHYTRQHICNLHYIIPFLQHAHSNMQPTIVNILTEISSFEFTFSLLYNFSCHILLQRLRIKPQRQNYEIFWWKLCVGYYHVLCRVLSCVV